VNNQTLPLQDFQNYLSIPALHIFLKKCLSGRKIDSFASNRIKKAGGITNQQDFSIRHT